MGTVISMEDQQEVNQASENVRGLDIEESMQLSIAIDESVTSGPSSSSITEQMFKNLEDASNSGQIDEIPKPRIQRISSTLHNNENFRKYFEPRVVAIGPLHHDNPQLEAAEKIKLKLAGVFIGKSGKDKRILYRNVLDELESLKECYNEEEIKKYSNEELAWILFVDGCAVLHYIDRVVNNELNDLKREMHVTRHVLYINEDLFLVENQLPHQVLELLMRLSERSADLKRSVAMFIYMNSMAPEKENWISYMEEFKNLGIDADMEGGRPQDIDMDIQPTHHIHLLSLLRKKLLQQHSSKDGQFIQRCLQFLRDICKKPDSQKKKKENIVYDWRPFHTAKELKAVGIQLKPCKSSCLRDISFSSGRFSGDLILPPIVIDNSAMFKFLNMIAFEMFPDFGNDFEVTSYICFLSSFIAHEDDVEELRSAGILYNRLGNDNEVRRFLHDIATNLISNPDAYSEVKQDIQAYFAHRQRAKIATWVADVKQDYFRNPWTAIAVIAAAFAILLSVLQTYYTIFPVNDTK